MTINLTLTLKAKIIFDGNFCYDAMSDKYYSLDELIEKARYYMDVYDFMSASIVDVATEEVAVTMEGDWQDEFDRCDYGDDYAPECPDDLE